MRLEIGLLFKKRPTWRGEICSTIPGAMASRACGLRVSCAAISGAACAQRWRHSFTVLRFHSVGAAIVGWGQPSAARRIIVARFFPCQAVGVPWAQDSRMARTLGFNSIVGAVRRAMPDRILSETRKFVTSQR